MLIKDGRLKGKAEGRGQALAKTGQREDWSLRNRWLLGLQIDELC